MKSQNTRKMLSFKQIELAKNLIKDGFKLKKWDPNKMAHLTRGKTSVVLIPKNKLNERLQ